MGSWLTFDVGSSQPEWSARRYVLKTFVATEEKVFDFSQLNAPLMVGYHLVQAQKMNLSLSLAPVLSYQLRAPTGVAYQKINAGGVVNVGVDLANLTLDLRYSRGLTTMITDLNERTSIVNLSVGYKFF